MNRSRAPRKLVAALMAGVLLVATTATMADAEDATGVGRAKGGLTVLSLDAGDLVKLAVLGEDDTATTNPDNGVASAAERLSPLTASSVAVPALGALTLPPVEVQSTGAESRKDTAIIDLGAATSAVPGLLAGKINPAALTSAVDVEGARAALTTQIADVSVLSGLVDSGTLNALLGGKVLATKSTSARFVDLDTLNVLDLSSLLGMLGIKLGDLPLGTAIGLVGQLGLLGPVASATGLDLSSISDLQSAIGAAQTSISTAGTTLASLPSAVGCVDTNPVLVLLGITCAGLSAQIATLTTTISAATAQLAGILDAILKTLDSAALVKIEAVQAGVVAEARGTVESSTADVVAKIGKVTVGGVNLGPIDLNATVQQVAGLANTIASDVNGVLATINPALGNLVSVKLLQEKTKVALEGNLVHSLADLTAIEVTVTPPDLCAVLGDLAGVPSTVGSLIAGVGGTLPATPVTDVLTQVGALVNCGAARSTASAAGLVDGVAAALSGPVTIKAVTVGSDATFRAVSTPATPTPTLPRTGGLPLVAPLIAAMLAVAALGLRRVLRTAIST
jgi:hypothetical protein